MSAAAVVSANPAAAVSAACRLASFRQLSASLESVNTASALSGLDSRTPKKMAVSSAMVMSSSSVLAARRL